MEKIEKISSVLQKHLPELKSKYKVATFDVFGSFVRDEQTAGSDLDILVSFTKSPSMFKFLELEDYLSVLFGVKVDLVMKSALKPDIGQRILSEAQSII